MKKRLSAKSSFVPYPFGLACTAERARQILTDRGCWPVRPHWWSREAASSDFYVIAALQDAPDLDQAIDAYLDGYPQPSTLQAIGQRLLEAAQTQERLVSGLERAGLKAEALRVDLLGVPQDSQAFDRTPIYERLLAQNA